MVLVRQMNDSAVTRASRELLRAAIARGVFPAATAEVGNSTGALWREALGSLTFDADAAPSELSTIFDLASLTKPIATTTVVLDLLADHRLSLDDPVSQYFGQWAGADRAPATVRLL